MNSNSQPGHKPNRNLNAAELVERLNSGDLLTLVDVREPMEYHTFNIGGTNIPLGKLLADIEHLELNKAQEIIVLCKAGLRSATAQSVLQQLGYTNVKNLKGGLIAVQRLQYSK
ncbi:rhodanese-like domain-containing protein [Mucilaginibacter sp.]